MTNSLKKLGEFGDKYEVRTVDRRRVEAAALSITLVFFLWLVLHVGGSDGVRYFDDIVTALAALSACVACLLAGKRQSGSERRFWALLGLALGAWTFAEAIWGVYDLVLNTAVPVPSWADVGYLGAIPLAAAALLCHPGMRAAGSYKTRATLDGLAIGTALLLLSWTFVLGPLWRHTDLTTAGGIVALAYPFGDMVIIFLIVLSVRSMTATGRRPLLWVLAGLFAMAVSDSTYAYLVEVGRYATGNLVDIGWVVGYLAIAVGASGDAGQTVRATSDAAGRGVTCLARDAICARPLGTVGHHLRAGASPPCGPLLVADRLCSCAARACAPGAPVRRPPPRAVLGFRRAPRAGPEEHRLTAVV